MKLSLYLKTKQVSIADFAASVGSSPFAVQKWLRGERTPRDVFMRRIMQVTEGAVSPNDFLSFADEQKEAV